MYTFVSALCLSRSIGAQWTTVDLSNILVYDIFNTYLNIYLTLTNPYLNDQIYVDLNDLREEYSSYNGTLNQLLEELGNRTLKTVDSLPNSQIKYVKYSDAYFSGYKVDTTIIGVGSPETFRPEERIDLKVTRPGTTTDLSLLHTHCLLSVNGYYHMTDTDGSSAYIKEGRKSRDRSNNNHVGITSFYDIGSLVKLPITEDMIYSQATDSHLYERTYLRINQDLTDKVVLFVIGGYLYLPQDGVFWQSGQQNFAINWSSIPLLQRYYESRQYLDLSSLGLSVSSENKDMVNVPELFSDDVIKKYLQLSQSFVVILDAKNIFSNKIFLKKSNMPGMFTAYQDPTYPLIVGYGKLAEYWKVFEDGYYSVTVQDSFMSNFVFDEKPLKLLNNVTPNAYPFRSFEHSPGFLLQIGTYQ